MATKAKKLFGTDGIRGKSNQFPMMPEVVVRVGQALGYLLRADRDEGMVKVLIGKDTRLSGYMIEMALASGLNSAGIHVQLVGPLPTPGIGFLARNMRADAGIVISASHNPYVDNGIKIFGSDGFKISRQMEEAIEDLVLNRPDLSDLMPPAEEVGRSRRIEDSTGRYVVFAKDSFPLSKDLSGMRIVLDTANGASYKVARSVFEELGAEIIHLGDKPNGTNINDKCGALYPESTAEAVIKYRADLGVCLDGDADRVILVDEKGKIVNGDHILAICGLHLKELGRLDKDTVVCTKMSNFGLFKFFEDHGIKVEQTDVGDKYVVQRMREGGFVLGGEQSGHIIFLEHSTTGDGIVAALNVLAVLLTKGKKLSELRNLFHDTPQVMKNVKVKTKPPLEEVLGFTKDLEFVEGSLGHSGRVIVRYSGTEALVRVLVEGPDAEIIEEHACRLSETLKKELS